MAAMTSNPYRSPDEGGTSRQVQLYSRHWITPLAFVPFVVLWLIHNTMDISDSMVKAPVFNTALAAAAVVGLLTYVAHAFLLFDRGWRWVG